MLTLEIADNFLDFVGRPKAVKHDIGTLSGKRGGATTATSYYDSAPLRDSLLELVDFSLINEQRTRFSVGAVNVLSGNFAYFDNAKEVIEPEHIMASGALPPALPMIKIGTDHFWDVAILQETARK